MKKRYRRNKMVSCLLAGLLFAGLLTGCGGENGNTSNDSQKDGKTEGGSGAKGRFMETELMLSESGGEIYAMRRLEDGSIGVMVQGGDLMRSSDGGETWERTMAGVLSGKDDFIEIAAIAPDGSAVAAGWFQDTNQLKAQSLKRVAADGTTKMVPISLPESEIEGLEHNFIYQVAFDDAGKCWIIDAGEDIYTVDLDTGECTRVIDNDYGDGVSFGIAGKKLLLIAEGKVSIYSTEDGKKLPEDPLLNEYITDHTVVAGSVGGAGSIAFGAGAAEGSIICADHSGVYYHGDGGTVKEQLVSGEICSLGDTSMSLMGIAVLDEEHFIIHVVDGAGKGGLLKYSYDKNVSAVPEKEITVYSLFDSSALRQAVSMYQKENKNVFVKLTIGQTGKDGVSTEDAVTALNTEIMAGNTPDVLILDGLPADSYIEKGVLADINGLVEELEASDGLFTNVADAYKKDGACYALPVRFYFTVAMGSKDVVESASSLETFADMAERLKEENPGRNILKTKTQIPLIETLYNADSAGWRTKQGELDEKRMENWLVQVKRLYDLDAWEEADTSGSNVDFLYGTAQTSGIGILTGENMAGVGTVTSLMDIVTLLAVDQEAGGTHRLFNGQQEKSFVPYLLAGRSSSTKAAEEAEGFLRVLFGKELSSVDANGYPLNRAGWEEVLKKGLELYNQDSGFGVAVSDDEGNGANVDLNLLNQEAAERITGMLESVNKPALTDAVIRELVLTQGTKYIKGEQTLENTTAAIRQKLNLYLAE